MPEKLCLGLPVGVEVGSQLTEQRQYFSAQHVCRIIAI